MDVLRNWASNKQSLAAMYSCEAELNASLTGSKLGIGIKGIVEELMGFKKAIMQLRGDNYATLHSTTNEVTSWRTRHYAMRAAGTRDLIGEEYIEVQHEKGTELVSDALRKVLDKVKLGEAQKCLQLR